MTLRDKPSAGDGAHGRFEMPVGEHIVFADYRRAPGQLVIDHVEAPVPLRGSGAAGTFMQALAEQARSEGRKIIPICGYAAAWLSRHPEHADLIARG